MTPLEESSSEVRFNAWWNQWRKGFDPGVTDGDVMSDMNSSEGAWEAQEAYWHEQLAAEKLVSEGLRRDIQRKDEALRSLVNACCGSELTRTEQFQKARAVVAAGN